MIQVTKNKEFHLQTRNTSYILNVLPTLHIGSLYYGNKIHTKDNYHSLYQNFTCDVGIEAKYSKDEVISLNTTCLELSSYGKSDYREPSIHLSLNDNTRVTDFLYKSYEIYDGKKSLEGLPHFFENNDTVKTLVITLKDDVYKVELRLIYNVFYDKDIITRSMELVNYGEELIIEKMMSFNLDFPSSDYEVITLEGHWIREKHIQRQKLNKGCFTIDSKRLASGAEHNPFMAIVDKNATEYSGECYGFGLVYSGNHQGLLQVSSHDILRIQMGINPFDFAWRLNRNESFQTPEVVMTYSKNGLTQMSQNFHKAIRENLIPLKWQYKSRPILFNSWEAMYFDFNEKKLLNLAKEGKKLGMELFVLDDGWFKGRNNDKTSLGDWIADTKKLPNGLKGLSDKVHDLKLEFGLWVEPEMISVESELYKKHPEWVIKLPNRQPSYGRNQLMLDMSNNDVISYLYVTLKELFTISKVSYVKWDMNRSVTDLYSSNLSEKDQKSLSHRYYLGLYRLLDKLKNDFKDVLFESCASGGNRNDLGMLYYMPQTWISDNTDPGERVKIQYGASLIFPLDTIGAHVGSNPSHQVLRSNDIETRFNVASFGVLGYELNLTKLSNFERKVIKKQVVEYKKHREVFQFGDFYRISSPFEENECTWMVTKKDKGILGYYQKEQKSNRGFEQIKLKGLNGKKYYKIENRKHYMNIERFGELVNEFLPFDVNTNGIKGLVHKTICDNYLYEGEIQKVEAYGDELMYAGFRPYHQFNGAGFNDTTRYIGDFGSRMYYINMIKPAKSDK